MIKENIAPVTLADRVLEVMAFALALFIVVITVVLYLDAPELVPVNFNIKWEPNRWEGNWAYFMIMAVAIACMAICSAAAYNHKMVNLPVRLNPKCMPQQLALLGRMMRIFTILLGLLFIVLLFMMSASQLGLSPEDFGLGIIVLLCLMTLNIIFYTLKIWLVGRRYK